MAGDWIKMRTDLLTSPKVVRMASALKADRFRIAGGLLSVWSLFDVHSADGVLSGYSIETLDDLSAWTGFSQAMADVGWLIINGENLELPRFDTHNGVSAKRRAQDADRKREARKPSAFDADILRTREEKRREENREDKSSCNQQADDGKKSSERIDYAAIAKAFGEHLAALPQPRDITEKRKKAIRSIVKRGGRYAEDDFFPKFFEYVSKSDFMMGRSERQWHGCCFDWLLKPENFQKIIEGNYHTEAANA